MKNSLHVQPVSAVWKQNSESFISDFLHSTLPKFVFGHNIYLDKILNIVELQGVIDEQATSNTIKHIPVINDLKKIPKNALILVLSGGSPINVLRKLETLKLRHLHYFSFYTFSNLDLEPIYFQGNFSDEYTKHRSKFEHIYKTLKDKQSKHEFEKVINFRYSLDLSYMSDFTTKEDEQYFEDFLQLKRSGESFVDIGAFDGFTSEEFIKLCPNYKHIDIFEPDEQNISLARKRLQKFGSITYHQLGLSDHPSVVKFSHAGSSSSINLTGEQEIKLNTLDEVLEHACSFIKIDIEGAEISALKGAKETIAKNHPIIAIAAYHSPEHLWQIPELILNINNDYDIYFRHYTQSLYESVLFFVPKHRYK